MEDTTEIIRRVERQELHKLRQEIMQIKKSERE